MSGTHPEGQASVLARVAALDAAGRHTDAIEELARAAQRNDVAATTLLAKRLIVGDRAPRLLRQGIDLLKDAVNLGGAEAADRLAVLFAFGIGAQSDWHAALRLLALAAERGWAAARGQLEVLASMLGGPAGNREALLDAAAVGRLLAAPRSSAIHEDPRIRLYPSFVNATACEWLIERARGRLEPALVYDVVRQVDRVDGSRSNSAATFHMMDADLVQVAVQTRIAAACGQPIAHLEAGTVLHYAVGETIGNHYDFVDPALPGYAEEIARRGTRISTFLVYLNDGYAGGETVFPELGVTHSGRRGEGLSFANTLADGRADKRTLHNGQPPTRGEKWLFSQFVRNRPEPLDA